MILTPESMHAAAQHLSRTERGRQALKGLKDFFERGSSLDTDNIHACLTLMHGFFGSWTGSAREAVDKQMAGEVRT